MKTVEECRAWIETLPTTDPVQSQILLQEQLEDLNGAGLLPAARLAILEALRGPVHFAQGENAKKFSGKPLPPSAAEQKAFDACRQLWQTLIDGYRPCLDACLSGDASIRPQAALVVQRMLAAQVMMQTDLYRSGRSPDAEFWRQVHGLYAAAEKLGVTGQSVEDRLRLGKLPTHPAGAYAEALLLHAARPHELAARHFECMTRWSRRWSAKIRVLDAPPTLSTKAIPLCVDLDSGEPADYRPHAGPGARWLETADLRHSLKKRIILLGEGRPPAELQLGDDCPQPACGQLLQQVYALWCKGSLIRPPQRQPGGGVCSLIAGIEGAHYFVSGRKSFKEPERASIQKLLREREKAALFGQGAAQASDAPKTPEHAAEEWRLDEQWVNPDEGTWGLRLSRPLASPGKRIAQGQLVAVNMKDAKGYLLGTVRWALLEGDEALVLGLHLYPGQPEAIAVRATGVNAAKESPRQALRLPAPPGGREPASVILMPGSFKPGRTMEIIAERPQPIKLLVMLDRGTDFERAAFENLGD